jgi:endonuclease III
MKNKTVQFAIRLNRSRRVRRTANARIFCTRIERLREAERLLSARYGTPRLGNKRDPISEIVFIILSARTRGSEHEAAYRRLRARFRTWAEVRDAPLLEIRQMIQTAGLSRIKALQIRGALRQLTKDLGGLSAASLRQLDDSSLEAYLTSLPGVGMKTARCVLLYSFDREVFPVDCNSMRLFENLGIISSPLRFEYAQDPLQCLVPSELRYSLHVNAVAHGRQTCIPGAPNCRVCPIVHLCVNRTS